MHTVNKSDVELVEGKAELTADASTIGLAPGVWPDHIAVLGGSEGDRDRSGLLFLKSRAHRSPENELTHVSYLTLDGRFTLTVFND